MMMGRAVFLEAISAKPQRNIYCEFEDKIVHKSLISRAYDRLNAFRQNRANKADLSRPEQALPHLLADIGLEAAVTPVKRTYAQIMPLPVVSQQIAVDHKLPVAA